MLQKFLYLFIILGLFIFIGCGEIDNNNDNNSNNDDTTSNSDNNKPSFNSIEVYGPVEKGIQTNFRIFASDNDGDDLFYSIIVSNGTLGTSTDVGNGKSFVYTAPDIPGTVTVTIYVSDSKDTVSEIQYLLINNQMPSVTLNPNNSSLTFGETISIGITGQDADINDTLFFTIITNLGNISENMSTSNVQTLQYTYDNNLAKTISLHAGTTEGTAIVTAYISDGFETSNAASGTYAIYNNSPNISYLYLATTKMMPNDTGHIEISATDADNQTLFYTFVCDSGSFIPTENNTTNTIYYVSPSAMDTYIITGFVSDGYETVSETATVWVTDYLPPDFVTISLATDTIALSDTGIYLKWISPGDDVDKGQATSYEVRLSSINDESIFDSGGGTILVSETTPLAGGELQTIFVPDDKRSYYLLVKYTDDADNSNYGSFDIRNSAMKTIFIDNSLSTINYNEEGEKILINEDGSYILGGIIDDKKDLWIQKRDNSHNIVWTTTINNTYFQKLGDIIRTSDSHYIVASSKYISTSKRTDAQLTKLSDTDGSVMWYNTFGGTSYDGYYGGATKVVEAADSGLLLLMNTNSSYVNSKSNPGQSSATLGTYTSVYLAKLDSMGNTIIWDKMYGGQKTDVVHSGYRIDTGFILFMTTNSDNISGVTRTDTIAPEGLIVIISDTGEILKQNLIDIPDLSTNSSNSFSIHDSIQYDSIFVLIGRANVSSGFSQIWADSPITGWSTFIMTVNSNGDTIINGYIGYNYFNGSSFPYQNPPLTIFKSNDGGFIIAGNTTYKLTGIDPYLSDHLIVKLDSAFQYEWLRIYNSGQVNGNNEEATVDIAQHTDGSYIGIGIKKYSNDNNFQIYRLNSNGY